MRSIRCKKGRDGGVTIEPRELGLQFAKAIGAKDLDHIRELAHPNLHFRALTPTKFQEAHGDEGAQGAIDIIKAWFFDEGDDVQEVIDPQVEELPSYGRYRLTYRLRLKSADNSAWFREEGWGDPADDDDWIVDQAGYYDVRRELIARMYLACSGFHLLTERR